MSFNPLNLSSVNPSSLPLTSIKPLKPSTMPTLNTPENTGTSWLKSNVIPIDGDNFKEQVVYPLAALKIPCPEPLSTLELIDGFSRFLKESHDLMIAEGLPTSIDPTMPLLDGLKKELIELSKEKIDIKAHAKELNTRIEKLKIGEEILLPGGIKETHLFYLIKKTKKELFSVSIYNTSQGNDFHHAEVVNSKMYHQSDLTYTNIPLSSLCRNEVFEGLVGLKVSNNPTGGIGGFYRLIDALGGKKEAPQNYKTHPKAFTKSQSMGDNPTKILFALLNLHMVKEGNNQKLSAEKSHQQYKLIKFFHQRTLLIHLTTIAFQEGFKDANPFDKTISTLLAKWARSAHKLAKEGFLPENTQKDCEATIIDIKQKLHEKKLVKKNAPIESDSLSFKSVIKNTPTIFPEIDSIKNVTYTNPSLYSSSSNTTMKTPASLPATEWKAETFNADLKKRINDLKAFYHDDYNKLVQDPPLVRLAKSLPLPSKTEKTLWDTLPEEDIEATLLLLEELAASMTTCKCTAETLLGKYSVMAIADRLARRLPETNLSSYKLPYYGIYRLAQSPEITLIENADHKRLLALMSYFDESIDIDALCDNDFEKFEENSLFINNSDINSSNLKHHIKKFSFISYYNDLLQKDEFKKQIPQENLKDPALMFNALFDGTVKLPHSINALKNICFHTCYSNYFSYHNKSENVDSKFDFKYKFNKTISWHSNKNEYHLDTNKTVDGASSNLGHESAKAITNEYHLNNHYSLEAKNPKFLGNKNLPQNKIVFQDANEATRENKILSSNFKDEVVRALSHYQEQDNLLEDPIEQAFLYTHLLRPGRLYSQITGEPRTALKLMSFLNSKADFFLSVGKRDHALFFIELAHICQKQIKEIQKEFPERFAAIDKDLKPQLRDYINEMHRIADNCPSLKSKEAVYNTLLRMHAIAFDDCIEKLNKDDVAIASDILLQWFIEPLTTVKTSTSFDYDYDKNAFVKKLENNRKKMKEKFNNSLFALINEKIASNEAFRKALFNKVASTIKGEEISHDWNKCKYLDKRYDSDDLTLSINLSHMTIRENNQAFTLFPSWIRDNKTFNKMVPSFKEENAKLITTGDIPFFEITCENGKTVEVHAIENATLWGEKKTDLIIKTTLDATGTKFRYTELSKISPTIKNLLPLPLQGDGTKVWIQDAILEGQVFNVCIETKEGRRFWAKFKETYGTHEFIGISKTANGGSPYLLTTKDVEELKNEEKMSALFNFMESNELLFWGDDHLKELEIPGFGKFVINDGIAHSIDISGFYLSEEQATDFIGKGPKCLLLNNDKGDRKVIMQRTAFQRTSTGNNDMMRPELSVEAGFDSAPLIYDLEEVNGVTRLVPGSVSDSLFLVYMMMAKMQYRQALYYLNSSCDAFKYTEMDLSIISKIKECIQQTPTPSALAIGLRLFIMAHENGLKYCGEENPPEVSKEDAVFLGMAYLEYLKNINNITLTKLSRNEEKTILRVLQSAIDKEIENAKKALNNVSEETSNMEALMNKIQSSLMDSMKTLGHPLFNQRLVALTNKNGSDKAFKCESTPHNKIPVVPVNVNSENTFLELLALGNPYQLENLPTITEITSIRNYLGNFYAVAHEGSKENKKILKNTLFVIENMLDGKDASETLADIHLIYAVLKNPKKFPSLQQINKAVSTTDIETDPYKKNYWKDQNKYNNRVKNMCKKIVGKSTPSVLSMLFSNLKTGFNVFIDSYKKNEETTALNELKFGLPDLSGVNSEESAISDLSKYDSLITLDEGYDQLFKTYEEEISQEKDLPGLSLLLTKAISEEKLTLNALETAIVSSINTIDEKLSIAERMKRWGKEKPGLTLEDAEELSNVER